MAYCSIADATAAGAIGTDAEKQAAIDLAEELINLYTGDLFEETAGLAVTGTYANGSVLLPYRLADDPAPTLRFVGQDSDVDASSYRLRTSSTGDINAIEFIGGGSYSYTTRVTVTGTFGWEVTPLAVKRACALIAAYLTKNPTGDSQAGARAISAEALSINYGDTGSQATTGVREADQLLAPYRSVVLA